MQGCSNQGLRAKETQGQGLSSRGQDPICILQKAARQPWGERTKVSGWKQEL